MAKEDVRSIKEKILCPLTINHPEGGDYCYRERCAWFDRAWDKCGTLSQSAMVSALARTLSDIVNLLQIELPNLRNELAQIGDAIIHHK